MPFGGGGVYAMSKSALQGLVKGLARDLGPRGITINNVQPGPGDTDMNPAEGEFAEMLKKLMALPRYGTVDEIAGMVAYLASPEAGFITGASLMIDGGFSAEQELSSQDIVRGGAAVFFPGRTSFFFQ
jgi:3-oxoacyl-[acyl-carrier protein] reductase